MLRRGAQFAPLGSEDALRADSPPYKGQEPPEKGRPVLRVPCGECGLKVRYFRGDMSPLFKHMSYVHPCMEVVHFGTSDVDEAEDEGHLGVKYVAVKDVKPEGRGNCSDGVEIKEKLFSYFEQFSDDATEQEEDSDHMRSRVKINLEVDNNDSPRRSRTRFTRTMKNDDEFYEFEKTREKSKPERQLSRELPMALRYLQLSGIDIGSPNEVKQTMVFRPPGKMYCNFRKFICPKCACQSTPKLTAVKEGRTLEMSWINNQCFLTTCWPLMLLPVFYAQPTVSFHMHCVQCQHYLGKLDRNGSVVAEVIVEAPNDASTTNARGRDAKQRSGRDG